MKKKRRWKVRIHPAGAALFVLALLFAPSRMALAAAAALIWHELSHVAAMLLVGIKGGTIELTPFGGMIDADGFDGLSSSKQALCALAGVIGSLAGAWSSWAFLPKTDFAWELFQNHVSLVLVNCLPAWPLDGARALMAAAAVFLKEKTIRRLLAMISNILAAALTLLGLYGVWHGMINPSLLMAGPYLFYAAREGKTSQQLQHLNASLQKTKRNTLLPVRLFASTGCNVEERFSAWIAQWPANQYHMLCEMDQEGKIKHLWTETEIWERVMERIDTEQT